MAVSSGSSHRFTLADCVCLLLSPCSVMLVEVCSLLVQLCVLTLEHEFAMRVRVG
jgi:hypothetical protein